MENGVEGPEEATVQELRRGYHNRIADLRAKTIGIVEDVQSSLGVATAAFLDQDREQAERLGEAVAVSRARVEQADEEVLELLALQSPVARDLRLILASRDVAQASDLCLGLCQTLASRIGPVGPVLSDEIRSLVAEVASSTGDLLGQVNGAWVALDEIQAREAIESTEEARRLQRRLLTAMLQLPQVPADAAVDLGMASRVYERISDHAVEIAARVIFTVSGVQPKRPLT